MRHATLAFLTTLLLAGPAIAGEGGGKSKEAGSAGGGSGSGGGSTGGGSGDASTRTGYGAAEGDLNLQSGGPPVTKKWWDLAVGWETHGLLWQNNHEGSGRDNIFNYGSFEAGATFLKYNRIDVEIGFYERFLADEGERGVRFDDTIVAYSRYVPLPRDFSFSGALRVALPTSFEAQKMGMIMAPTIRAAIAWKPRMRTLRGLSAEFRLFGTPYLMQYTASEGGNYNPRGRFGAYLSLDYSLPVLRYRPFGVGVNAYSAYYWYFDVGGAGGPNMTLPGATSDATYPGQPAQQKYGGEAYLRYTMPSFYGLKGELKVAFADGDSALGYGSLLHDGIAHVYLSYFRSAEFYGAFTLRY